MITIEFELSEIEDIPSIVVEDILMMFDLEEFYSKREDEISSIDDPEKLRNIIKCWCQEEVSTILNKMGELYEEENGDQEKDPGYVFQDAIAGEYYGILIREMVNRVLIRNNKKDKSYA